MATAAPPPLVLVVDGTPAKRRKACALIERDLGWRTAEAGTGGEALAHLDGAAPAAVLTDPQLPDMDGTELVEAVRRSHPFVPVVLLTTKASEQAALKALQQGAATYVPRGEMAAELADSLERVVAAARASQNRRRLLMFLTRVEFEFDLENDPTLIPVLVAQVQEQLSPLRLCDQNGLIRVGVALEEAILNAMYHGNLEVSSQLRQEDESLFHKLIEERRQDRPYALRRLTVWARLTPERAEFEVADEGPGFDPNTLPDPTDPANLERIGGRGLLLIRTFMDEVTFNARGNRITLVKNREAGPAGGAGGSPA
jgi:CheY-like chemotaxis protein/anti-sigma regulatory factor (Ser/Thr protein kinase)